MRATDPDPASSAERHFIELATRPLEDCPEVRDEARAELMGRLQAQGPEEREAALGHALGRLAKVVPGRWQGKAAAFAASWLVLAALTGWGSFEVYRQIQSSQDQTAAFLHWKGRNLSTEPQTFTEPAEYEAFIESTSPLPSGYLGIWTGIDPDNGAWAWREAVERADRWNSSYAPRSSGTADFDAAWKLAGEAAQTPRFQRYARERRAAWWMQWGNPETILELQARSADSHVPTTWVGPDRVGYLFMERARRACEAKDPESLRSTIRTWEQLCLKVAESSAELEEPAKLVNAGHWLEDAARLLGMTAEAEKIASQITAAGPAWRDRHGRAPSGMGQLANRLYYNGTLQRAPLTDLAALEPGRMAEYAYTDRRLVLAAAILLLPALGIVLFESIRRGKRVNGLASGLAPLFTGRDGLWMLGLGLLTPFSWYWGITRLTPLGWRDLGITEFGYPVHLFQAAACLLLVLVLTVQTGQWRISRHAAFLGLGARHLWIGWAVVGITAALLPLAGLGRWLPETQIGSFVRIYQASGGIPLLWLLWRAGALLFVPNDNALGGVMLARTAALPLLLALALLAAFHPMLIAAEKSWIAKDEVAGWDASRGMTKQEARAIDAVAARCREVFGDTADPSPPR